MAEVVHRPLGESDEMGQIVQVADDGRDEHGADVGGQGEVQGLKALAEPGPDPHRDQQDDQVLEQDIRFPVLAGRRRFLRLGDLGFDDFVGARGGSRAGVDFGFAELVPVDEKCSDRAADQAAADDPEHRRGHGDRGGSGTPAFSNNGAKASPVAGPPVRVTEPARTPNSGLSPKGRAIAAPRRF